VGESALNVAMFKLRSKLGAAGADIEAVRGVGYAYRPRRRAIVSLGSNIEPREAFLSRALAALGKMPRTRLVAASAVEETEPVDVPPEFASQRFLNQVAVFETSLDPREFSRRMHRIEDVLGRVRTVRNGPRTIDLDLIDFGGMVLSEPGLTLPHPRALGRDFVTRPLAKLGIRLGTVIT
ncbi:MAG: 2-amino-4-hydroxy-6-hydroxymethyldihydropteridine diphosphokinase, partial [Kiritimatiellae bacterium]|nr:2-amino-4-hydroxy-6-hydroxymethyldihydropteridine diphosphokinase [Kiritimatiellia bacterium]